MDTKPRTRRRAETRQRLLDAAREVFAREGFGRATVEQVCEAAGFTRGAFYSNFTSLDELFLAMWQHESDRLVVGLRELLGATPPEFHDLSEAVDHVLGAIPVDEEWFRITAEFTAHALRTPGLPRVMAARERAIQQALLPVLDDLLSRIGRRITDRDALGRALVAVHDGTLAQIAIEPRSRDVRRHRAELFTLLLEHYTIATD